MIAGDLGADTDAELKLTPVARRFSSAIVVAPAARKFRREILTTT